MGFAFLIMLREGLEIALIVAIVLAYLKRLGRERDFRPVWIGTGAGVGMAIVAGAAVFAVLGHLEGKAEALTEGIVAFVATAVLSWMIFWMARQARFIKASLQDKVDAALLAGSASLATIAFVAVVREGLEAALFMISSTVGERSDVGAFLGGLGGLAIACGIGYLIYRGSRRINLRLFFRVTGVVVILFAAGLLATGIHEFQEAGLFATSSEHLWNLSHIAYLNPSASILGEFLHGLFNWSPAPSAEMVLAYSMYLVPVAVTFLVITRKVPLRAAKPAEAGAPAA